MKGLSNRQLVFLLEGFNTLSDDGRFTKEEDQSHIIDGLRDRFNKEISSRGFRNERELEKSHPIFDSEETIWKWD